MEINEVYYEQYKDNNEDAIEILNRKIKENTEYDHEIVNITVVRYEQPINYERNYITVKWTLKEVE